MSVRIAALALVAVLAACGGDDRRTAAPPQVEPSRAEPAPADGAVEADRFPDIVDVEISDDGGTFRFDVTVSSPYDTPERYADAWRVVAPDGTVLGVRELLHDHANEQPFTRSLTGVAIPDDVDAVTVEGRDLVNGWGGATVTVAVPSS